MNAITLTVLVENTAQGHGRLAEHGLSFWIEHGGRRILFDGGQSDILFHNAGILDLEITALDALILSHGHYDHTGGFGAIPWMNTGRRKTELPLYAHPRAWESKYARNPDGTGRYIGMDPASRMRLQESFERRDVQAPADLGGGLMVTGPIPRITDFEDTGGPFFTDNACREPDPLEDDQAACMQTPSGMIVILGCAHAGIINTLEYITRLAPRRPIHTVIGGTHLNGASETRLRRTIEALRAFNIHRFFPLHCTGFHAAARLSEAFPGRVAMCPVGTRLEFLA